MKTLLYSIIAVMIGAIAWAGTDSWFISGIISAIIFAYLFFYVDKILSSHRIHIKKRHECYQFINSFIIAISVKKTVGAALETITDQFGGALKEELQSVEHLDSLDTLTYLNKYFSLPLYDLFLKIINLYLEQGRDILLMSELLIYEARRMEENINVLDVMGKRKALNFSILWIMTAIIILFCRFGIRAFYLQMLNSPLFLSILVGFFLFALLSFHLMLRQYVEIS
ncbi:MAG: hypothetical protein NTV44_04880 [Firmicutes bacterium]|nr:hypothetical protein [Bacillota bacterium]